MHIIQTENIAVQYDPALPKLAFPNVMITKQDKILLLGDSGCGKTSLLSVIAGLLPPTTGQVLMNNQDIYQMTTKARDDLRGKQFGFVFQTLHLLPSLTIEQNIMLASDMAKLDVSKDRLDYLLTSLSIDHKRHAKPAELSQGQQQRAALARALINSPASLIADEPTSALDDKNAQIVMDLLIEQTQKSNTALLVATHDHRIKNRFDKIVDLSVSQQQVA